MDRLKDVKKRLLALGLRFAPMQIIHALDQLQPLTAPDVSNPQNPLRDAVDNRLSLFGPRR